MQLSHLIYFQIEYHLLHTHTPDLYPIPIGQAYTLGINPDLYPDPYPIPISQTYIPDN